MNDSISKVKWGLKLFILIGLHCIAGKVQAQSEPGNWLMATGMIRVHPLWSGHAEIQYRNYELLPSAEQLLLRTGVNYHLSDQVLLTAGYAHISNYLFEESKRASQEHRLWQQVLLRQSIGRLRLEHRYRLEQRWLKSAQDTYLDRFRYLVRVSMPLNRPKLTKNTIFATAYDEVFIHFNDSPFDRNRLYGALGYQFSGAGNVQLGYLAQTVGTKTRSYLQMGLFYNLDLRRQDDPAH